MNTKKTTTEKPTKQKNQQNKNKQTKTTNVCSIQCSSYLWGLWYTVAELLVKN